VKHSTDAYANQETSHNKVPYMEKLLIGLAIFLVPILLVLAFGKILDNSAKKD
jgi:hypothetical protein